MAVRLDRMEGALRQLTGTIEQLQYRNQQLELQLKRMQDDTEYRFQQMGGKGGSAPSQIALRHLVDRPAWRPVQRPATDPVASRHRRRAAVPTCSIHRNIRTRRVRRAPWETRQPSRRPNRGRVTYRRSEPRVAAPPAHRSIYRRSPETIPHLRKQAHRRQWRRRRRLSHPRRRCRCRHRKARHRPHKHAMSAPGGAAARDTSAFGHAAGRVRHGLRLRPA